MPWHGTYSGFDSESDNPSHVQHADGEAKFWIDPAVELFANYGLKPHQLAEAEKLIREHIDDVRLAWAKHFPS